MTGKPNFRTGCLTTEYTEHTEKAKYERTFKLKNSAVARQGGSIKTGIPGAAFGHNQKGQKFLLADNNFSHLD